MEYSAEDDAAPVEMLAAVFEARGWPCEMVSDEEMSGEVQGNIHATSRVELLETAVINGDVKAAVATVAPGSRMRGQADFGANEHGPGGK